MTDYAVYKFKKYQIETDKYVVSKRRATLDVIKEMGFVPDLASEQTVSADMMDPEYPGMTKIIIGWFDPGS